MEGWSGSLTYATKINQSSNQRFVDEILLEITRKGTAREARQKVEIAAAYMDGVLSAPRYSGVNIDGLVMI